jgi:hypothetical protein
VIPDTAGGTARTTPDRPPGVGELLAWAAFSATAIAGVIGVLRQRREVRAVRRGELVPASAAADVAPRQPAGAVGERLASWVPPRPATPVGRAAAALWAAPLTLVGFGVAGASGRLPRWDASRACFVARGVGGASSRALQLVGADANTIGQVVLARQPDPPSALLDHEAVHVRQCERLGPLMIACYPWLSARYGYRDHPLERAARTGARRASGASGDDQPRGRTPG